MELVIQFASDQTNYSSPSVAKHLYNNQISVIFVPQTTIFVPTFFI